ncbi:putative CRM domain-containing protein [Forsythia ovata]|uniref:CRM domain-containing protein n=1 Tax=Forsythia ovata TaxID=205694 RepID=A0ABD1WGA1_9LAMI
MADGSIRARIEGELLTRTADDDSVNRLLEFLNFSAYDLSGSLVESLIWYDWFVRSISTPSFLSEVTSLARFICHDGCVNSRNYKLEKFLPLCSHGSLLSNTSTVKRSYIFEPYSIYLKLGHARHMSNASIELKTDEDVVRFNIGNQIAKGGSQKKGKKTSKRVKISRKAKLNELRFFRLKAKKKMNSPNPEVRIRYKLEKAKRKEEWLIEKLRKYDVPKAPQETYDPKILTEEERFYLKRTGEKKKNYCPLGRRGVFGGVVLNMHVHWKKHETVKEKNRNRRSELDMSSTFVAAAISMMKACRE